MTTRILSIRRRRFPTVALFLAALAVAACGNKAADTTTTTTTTKAATSSSSTSSAGSPTTTKSASAGSSTTTGAGVSTTTTKGPDSSPAGSSTTTTGGPEAAATSFVRAASLSGADEAPGPGDPTAQGNATFTVDKTKYQVCWDIKVTGIKDATAAHIHRAPEGEAGPVVVPLSAPTDGVATGCATVDTALANDLENFSNQFYANVHTPAFPDGAIRGQIFG